jgi:hypothetical protein
MVDASSVAGLVSTLKSLGEVASATLKLRDRRMIDEKLVEINGIVLAATQYALAAHAAQSECADRVRGLEAQIREYETWAAEQEKYELAEISPRVFAYARKEAMRGTEPMHWLCAGCFQQRKKSILQSEGVSWEIEPFSCSTCKAEIKIVRAGQGGPNIA